VTFALTFVIAVHGSSLVLWLVWWRLERTHKRPLRQSKLRPAGWGLIAAALGLAVFFLAQRLAVDFLVRFHGLTGDLDVGALVRPSPLVFMLSQLAAYLLASGYVLILAAQYTGRKSLQRLGLSSGGGVRFLKDAGYGAVACVMVFPVVMVLASLVWRVGGELGYDMQRQEMVEALGELAGRGGFWFIALQTIILAPLFEELVFRGWFYQGLRRHLKPVWATFICAGVFGVIHGAYAALPLFVLALVLCYLYERTGRLVAPIVLHASFNAVMVLGNVLTGTGGIRGTW